MFGLYYHCCSVQCRKGLSSSVKSSSHRQRHHGQLCQTGDLIIKVTWSSDQ